MKTTIKRIILLFIPVFFLVCWLFFRSCTAQYKQLLIDPGSNFPKLDSVELGVGRNDGVLRLYTTRDANNSLGYEYSFKNGKWSSLNIFYSDIICVSPVIKDLKNEGSNTLYLGGWNNLGVLMLKFSSGWLKSTILPRSTGKGTILAMKASNGRNDGVNRLYVAHWSNSGLVEYSWNRKNSGYKSNQLMNTSVGRFAIGQGRNDGINRIYAVERGGSKLHELTWNGSIFTDEVIFDSSKNSNGSVFVADGRGDHVNRIYVWAGGLFELTYKSRDWSKIILDEDNIERYYITAGSIRIDKRPGVYVSVKNKGLHEYSWSKVKGKFEVDAITSATGGCVIGDGRGDGKNRLYVASGTKGNYKKAAIVEIWEEVAK